MYRQQKIFMIIKDLQLIAKFQQFQQKNCKKNQASFANKINI